MFFRRVSIMPGYSSLTVHQQLNQGSLKYVSQHLLTYLLQSFVPCVPVRTRLGLLHFPFLGGRLIAGAGGGSLPKPTASNHLQTSPLLLLFILRLGKMWFYLDRVDVGVEVGHDGKDDAHHHQQRGEQDVLSPLKHKHTSSDSSSSFNVAI